MARYLIQSRLKNSAFKQEHVQEDKEKACLQAKTMKITMPSYDWRVWDTFRNVVIWSSKGDN